MTSSRRAPGPRLALALLGLVALAFPPLIVRASRIAPAEARGLVELLGAPGAAVAIASAAAALVVITATRRPAARVALSLSAVAGLLIGLGMVAGMVGPTLGPYARISPGPGAWLLLAALALLFADAAARLSLGAGGRMVLGAAIFAGALALLATPPLGALSLLVEYHNRAASFRDEAARHLMLAFGSFAAALVAGVPLGLVSARRPRVGGPVLGLFTAIQTVPSMAMFGLMIPPLAWLALNFPLAGAAGIRGIGAAPALIGLFLYALPPIVGHTIAGIQGTPPAVLEAASAIGLDRRQRLWRVEIPLALPVILTGARIVLVQNIGLATVGALIGAGGFGVFVFQGIGQTASDLVLLGALPPVALAMMAALLMDALIAALPGARR